MTTDAKEIQRVINQLNALQTNLQKFDAELDKFCSLIRDFFDTELIEAAYSIVDIIVKDVCESIECTEDVIFDWIHEHKFGKKPMLIYLKDSEEPIEIKSNSELINVLIKI